MDKKLVYYRNEFFSEDRHSEYRLLFKDFELSVDEVQVSGEILLGGCNGDSAALGEANIIFQVFMKCYIWNILIWT